MRKTPFTAREEDVLLRAKKLDDCWKGMLLDMKEKNKLMFCRDHTDGFDNECALCHVVGISFAQYNTLATNVSIIIEQMYKDHNNKSKIHLV